MAAIDFDKLVNAPIMDAFANATFDLYPQADRARLVPNMRGEFRRDQAFIDSGDGAETTSRLVMLAVRPAEFPPGLAEIVEDDLICRLVVEGDASVLPHHDYRVAKVDADATGLVWLQLHRVK